MMPPPLNSVWRRYDGAVLKVMDVHGRDVFTRVMKRPMHGWSRLRTRGHIAQHVLSDFDDELGNTFMRRIDDGRK